MMQLAQKSCGHSVSWNQFSFSLLNLQLVRPEIEMRICSPNPFNYTLTWALFTMKGMFEEASLVEDGSLIYGE